MSDNKDFVSDLDAILAEFTSYGASEPVASPPKAPGEPIRSVKTPVQPDTPPRSPAQSRRSAEPDISIERPLRNHPEPEFDFTLESVPRKRQHAVYSPMEPEISAASEMTPSASRRHSETAGEKAKVKRPSRTEFDPELFSWQDERRKGTAHASERKPAKVGNAQRFEPQRRPEKSEKTIKAEQPRGFAHVLITVVSLLLSVVSLLWVAVNVHPDTATAVADTTFNRTDLVSKFNAYINNAASDALGDVAYIKKIYTIAENATVAPKPDDTKYHVTTNPQEVMDLIDSAAVLLEGQDVIFSPDVNFFPGSVIKYYYDDTILAIAWKELIDGRCCTFSEVKIAHGSQLKRKLADDSYNPGIRYYATDLAKASNAVLAINGDFYDFRNMGITVYQRQVYRVNPAAVDTCYFTASGDMLFSHKGELAGEGEAQAFVDANDIVFGVAFGPILVDNGELIYCPSYPIGEIDKTQSRAAICLVDTLHYMTMNVNYEGDSNVTIKLNDFGQFIYNKGVKKAYALDGGQTSILVMQNEMFNRVDWGDERTMSDILYFATAIPETEVAP